MFPLRAYVPLKKLHEFGITAKDFLVVFYVPSFGEWRVALPIHGGEGCEGSMVHMLVITRIFPCIPFYIPLVSRYEPGKWRRAYHNRVQKTVGNLTTRGYSIF